MWLWAVLFCRIFVRISWLTHKLLIASRCSSSSSMTCVICESNPSHYHQFFFILFEEKNSNSDIPYRFSLTMKVINFLGAENLIKCRSLIDDPWILKQSINGKLRVVTINHRKKRTKWNDLSMSSKGRILMVGYAIIIIISGNLHSGWNIAVMFAVNVWCGCGEGNIEMWEILWNANRHLTTVFNFCINYMCK